MVNKVYLCPIVYKNPSGNKLYTLGKTTVMYEKGDLFSFKKGLKNSEARGIAISVKCDLRHPHHDNPGSQSLDFQLRKKLKNDSIKLYDALEKLKHKHSCNGLFDNWVDEIENIQLNSNRIFVLAGIDAIPDNEEEIELLRSRKDEIIFKGISELCKISDDKKIKHLAIPIIGTGAGGVNENEAMHSILRGINRSAYKKHAPETISLFFWPKGNDEKEKNAWYSKRVRMMNSFVNNEIQNGKNGKDYNIWDYEYPIKSTIQILVLLMAVCISGLIYTYKEGGNNTLTMTVILGNTLKWIILTTGIFTFSTGSFSLPKPLDFSALFILFVVIIFMSLWEWYKLGDIPKNNAN